MEALSLDDVKPGMKIAKDILSSSGKVLLFSGSYVKASYIDKLRNLGIEKVYIDKNDSFIKIYEDFSIRVEDIFTNAFKSGLIDVECVEAILDALIDIVGEIDFNIILLNRLQKKDFYTYYHSLDVCLYSLAVGKNIEMDDKELRDLGRGALLHDVGKCEVPDDILLKPGKLTDEEFELIKRHTNKGYEILLKTGVYNDSVARIALEHHEKWDGSGYPLGIRDEQISFWARIVTIADIYDALTSDRVYKSKVLPHEAAEYILSNAGLILDPVLTKVFLFAIDVYPVGARVLLSTGEEGIVIDSNRSFPLRPKIKISTTDKIIDLEKHPSVFIKNLI
ncbi:MAG: HD domain-containing protein [Thermoanaerobacteraceae bacterium]|nr:HD domain-containing protein [Thermoanaerobacteraceae bacterium]